MKNRLIKAIALVLACVSIVSLVSFSVSATAITINHQYGNSTGYSERDHYSSSSRTWGYSEGSAIHNSAGNFYYSAFVNKGNLNYASLYAYAKSVNGNQTTYYNGTAQSNINKTSQNVTFDFSTKHNIVMEESAFTGTDRWGIRYNYVWNYYSPENRYTLVSGTYNII